MTSAINYNQDIASLGFNKYLNYLEDNKNSKSAEVFENIIRSYEALATLTTTTPGKITCLEGVLVNVDKLRLGDVLRLLSIARFFFQQHKELDAHLAVTALNPLLKPQPNPHTLVSEISTDIAAFKKEVLQHQNRPPLFLESNNNKREQLSTQLNEAIQKDANWEAQNGAKFKLLNGSLIASVCSSIGGGIVALGAPAAFLVSGIIAGILDIFVMFPVALFTGNVIILTKMVIAVGIPILVAFGPQLFFAGLAIALVAGGIALAIFLSKSYRRLSDTQEELQKNTKQLKHDMKESEQILKTIKDPHFQEFAFFFEHIMKESHYTESQTILPFQSAYQQFLKIAEKGDYRNLMEAVVNMDEKTYTHIASAIRKSLADAL